MIKPLFDFLATELSLTKGTDFHMGHRPPNSVDNNTTLLERVPSRIDPDNKNFRVHHFQILTRDRGYVAGDTEARRVSDAMAAFRGEAITGWYIYDTTGTGPAYLGDDTKGRHEFTSNFTVSARKD